MSAVVDSVRGLQGTTRDTSLFHSQLAENINSANPVVAAGMPAVYDLRSMAGMTALNVEVTRQASFLAYLNDFRIMRLATVAAVPSLLLMTRSRSA